MLGREGNWIFSGKLWVTLCFLLARWLFLRPLYGCSQRLLGRRRLLFRCLHAGSQISSIRGRIGSCSRPCFSSDICGTVFKVASLITLGQLATCSTAAYAFACIRFRGRDFIFFLLLSSVMIPIQVTVIPPIHTDTAYRSLWYSCLINSACCCQCLRCFPPAPVLLDNTCRAWRGGKDWRSLSPCSLSENYFAPLWTSSLHAGRPLFSVLLEWTLSALDIPKFYGEIHHPSGFGHAQGTVWRGEPNSIYGCLNTGHYPGGGYFCPRTALPGWGNHYDWPQGVGISWASSFRNAW